MIATFGGGEIAERGIRPFLGTALSTVGLHECDVTDSRAVREMFRCMRPPLAPHTRLDAVIYTAGVSLPSSLAVSDFHAFAREIEVNLLGAFNVAKAGIDAGVKTFIFIASLAGLYGKPNHAGYSASKAGMISLVQSLAMEGHNAYAISPGRVQTAMRERDYPGEDPRTRLNPLAIGEIVRDILAGKYTPGDNVVIRMRGHEVLPIEIHRGDGWRERLKVGEPPTC